MVRAWLIGLVSRTRSPGKVPGLGSPDTAARARFPRVRPLGSAPARPPELDLLSLPPGFSPPGLGPRAWPPGFGSPGHWSPRGMAPRIWPPGFGPRDLVPRHWSPGIWSPGIWPPGIGPPGIGPPGFGPPGFGPPRDLVPPGIGPPGHWPPGLVPGAWPPGLGGRSPVSPTLPRLRSPHPRPSAASVARETASFSAMRACRRS